MPYRFAIIGCGNIASRHAAQASAFGQLIAVCDIDVRKADDLAGHHHVTPYYSIETMLLREAVDVVVVCTPNGLHHDHCVKALQSGCHVLCEKPLSTTVSDGMEMIRAAEDAKKKLFVVKQNRFNEPVVAVKRLLDEGKLGRIHSFQVNCFWHRPELYYQSPWRGTALLDGGILFTQFSHFIDLLYWFLGDIHAVRGWRSNYQHHSSVEFEDTGGAALVMADGSAGTISYTINAHSSNMEGSLTLFGERGTVKIGGGYLNKLEYFSVENEMPPAARAGGEPNRYGFYQGSMSNHDMVYKELLKALDDPGYRFLEASEALKSVEMIRQIYDGSPFIQYPKAHD